MPFVLSSWLSSITQLPDSPITQSSLLSDLDPQVDLHPLLVLLDDPVVLAQRVALPFIRQHDAPQVRMPYELDPEHVVALALQPVRRRPQRRRAGHAFPVLEL